MWELFKWIFGPISMEEMEIQRQKKVKSLNEYLMNAVLNNSRSSYILFLLNEGASAVAVDETGNTPLEIAIEENQQTYVEMFVSRSLITNTEMKNKIIFCAVRSGNPNFLLNAINRIGIASDAVDEEGNTPLILAIKTGQYRVIPIIFSESIVNISQPNKKGETAISLVLNQDDNKYIRASFMIGLASLIKPDQIAIDTLKRLISEERESLKYLAPEGCPDPKGHAHQYELIYKMAYNNNYIMYANLINNKLGRELAFEYAVYKIIRMKGAGIISDQVQLIHFAACLIKSEIAIPYELTEGAFSFLFTAFKQKNDDHAIASLKRLVKYNSRFEISSSALYFISDVIQDHLAIEYYDDVIDILEDAVKKDLLLIMIVSLVSLGYKCEKERFENWESSPLRNKIETEQIDSSRFIAMSGASTDICSEHDNLLSLAVSKGNLAITKFLALFAMEKDIEQAYHMMQKTIGYLQSKGTIDNRAYMFLSKLTSIPKENLSIESSNLKWAITKNIELAKIILLRVSAAIYQRTEIKDIYVRLCSILTKKITASEKYNQILYGCYYIKEDGANTQHLANECLETIYSFYPIPAVNITSGKASDIGIKNRAEYGSIGNPLPDLARSIQMVAYNEEIRLEAAKTLNKENIERLRHKMK